MSFDGLEVLPGAEAESDDLRALASHLRNVAVELRPPVLDDLGLPAALEYLAEQKTTTDQRTGFCGDLSPRRHLPWDAATDRRGRAGDVPHRDRGRDECESGTQERPPSRSGADVQPSRVELLVIDNGSGFDERAWHRTREASDFGLSSMRRRAQAIDADLSISAASPAERGSEPCGRHDDPDRARRRPRHGRQGTGGGPVHIRGRGGRWSCAAAPSLRLASV